MTRPQVGRQRHNGTPDRDPTQTEAAELAAAHTAPSNGTHAPNQPPETDEADTAGHDQARKSVSTVLVEIAHSLYRFGISDSGEPFAVPKTGAQVVSMLRGGRTSLRAQLASEYYRRTRRTAPQQALADALLVIEGAAQETDEQALHLRVATHGEATWLDLGDPTGSAVKITAQGWSIETAAPVLFRRTVLTTALPAPAPGGDLAELWRWLNVEPEDRPLLAAWLVAALRPDIPHPALGLFGEQGTGKTTAMKLVVSAVDATPVPARKPPKDADAWVTAAAGSWVVGLDNLSDITPWLSDSICRAVTGDGDVRRMLFKDADLVVFTFRRCIVINGIDLGGLRGDLADRLVPIHLHRIADTHRLDEQQLWPAWTHAHPRILGAILDLAVAATHALPTIELATKPRMADFARILAAVDHVLGTSGLRRYLDKQGALATDTLTDDDFITAIHRHLDGTYTGTSTELLQLVTPDDPDWRPPKNWPRNARAVTTRLHRQAPVMRKAGWTIDDDAGKNKQCVVRWTIEPPARDDWKPPLPDLPSLPQAADQNKQLPARAGQAHRLAGQAGQQHLATPSALLLSLPDQQEGTAGQRPSSRPAGQAGNESGALTYVHPTDDVWTHEHPCTGCGHPTTDLSAAFCADCITARARNIE